MADIDDPFKPPDATILRPRPGAGRRGAGEAGPPARPLAPPPPPVEPISSATADALGTGLNPLIQAASPLLLLAGQLRGTLAAPDVAGLRRHALDEIQRFEERARGSGIQNEIVLGARYALCAGLDEAVLSTPWGAHSEWAQQTLLVALHHEAWGGEKFFEMLDRISQDSARHLDLMELQYICLALGFAGKYQVLDRGEARLADVRQELYRRLRGHRGAAPDELSLRWRGLEDRRNPVIRYVPWWVAGAGTLTILAVAFVFFYSRLGSYAAPLHAQLAAVGLEDFTTSVATAPGSGPTLRQLLASEEARGALAVDEQGGRTVVTLLGGELFASGSAAVNPSVGGTLQNIAAALNKVPGRVLILGHTDDQPIRSLRFSDNVALSRERAVSVARLLQRALDVPARVEWAGVGASQPRFRPESDPANRVRNRRVEIVHVRG